MKTNSYKDENGETLTDVVFNAQKEVYIVANLFPGKRTLIFQKTEAFLIPAGIFVLGFLLGILLF